MTSNNVFAALNDYFDKIYVITLEGCDDRQESIRQNFKGLDYCFWQGTDKRKLPKSVMSDTTLYNDEMHKKVKRTTRSLSLGEYACACSHRSIYQDVVDNDYGKVLILEDDAVPVESQLHSFTQKISTLPNDWDVLLFDYYDEYLPSMLNSIKKALYKLYHKLGVAKWQNVPLSLIDNIEMREFNRDFYLPGKLSGAHAYAVSQKASKEYLSYQTPIILQADRIFFYFMNTHKLKEFALRVPMFARGEVSEKSVIDLYNIHSNDA